MKNFKKVLALVLAIATILSFATIASAATADFKDAKDVTHTEAVDVLSAIGVLNGYKDGEYKPNRVITRAEAAKIIAMFDNGDTDIKELYAPVNFTDVKAGHWAESFISYCYHTGIIAGVGNNKYAPDADVTGVQFLKMVLVVLGFDAKEEGLVGTGYSVRARNLARAIGLLNGIGNDFDYTKGLTRDNAAQIMLNALQTSTVEYGKVVTIAPGVAFIGDSKATFTGKLLANEWNLRVELTVDHFGRPGHKWSFYPNDYPNHGKEVVIANYVDTPVATYTTEVDGCTVYDDLGVELAYKAEHLAEPGATSWTDGVEKTKLDTATGKYVTDYEVIKDKTSSKTGAQGQLTEIYAITAPDTKIVEYRIVHINTYLAQVTDVKDEVKDGRNHVQTPRYVIATVYTRSNNDNYKAGTAMATLTNTGFVTENFAIGDFVLVQGVVKNMAIDIKSMTAAKTELTKLTGLDNISAVANMYVNGTKTPVAAKYAYDADRTVADCWDTFTFIYDSYGNVIGTTKYTAPANYAVLDKLYIDYAKGDGTVYATVVTPAGEKTDITVNTITAILPGNENTGKAVKAADFIASLDDDMLKGLGFQYQWSGSKFYSYYYGQLVDYVVNEDGSYDINIPGRAKQVKNAIIVKGSKFIYDGTNTKIPVLEVTADTIFLYQNGYAPNATYTSVTGYENLPATLVATEIQYIVKGGKVALVYVLNPQPVNSYKQVYYAGGQPSYDTSTGVGIYTYAVKVLGENGMEDGVITSKEPVFSGKPAGVYKVTLNASGLATKVELASADNYVVTLHAAPVNNTTYWYGTDEAHAKILDLSVVAFFNVSGDNTVNKTNLDGKNVSLIFDANGAAVAAYYYG